MTVRARFDLRSSHAATSRAIPRFRPDLRSVRSRSYVFSVAGRLRRLFGSTVAVVDAVREVSPAMTRGADEARERSRRSVADSVSLSMPCSRSRAAVTGPTPQRASTGNSCRKASTRSGATTVKPSGFFQPERSSPGTCSARRRPTPSGRWFANQFEAPRDGTPSGSPQAFSVTSRYASSSDNGSTSGVTSENCEDLLRHGAVLPKSAAR